MPLPGDKRVLGQKFFEKLGQVRIKVFPQFLRIKKPYLPQPGEKSIRKLKTQKID